MVESEHSDIFSGGNPIKFSETNPLSLFIIQVVIIVGFTRIIGLLLLKLKQPRVIAEVIGGILLGPSGLSAISAFKENVFPKDSLNFLNLFANIGLVFYLFLVGLELDPRVLTKNIRKSLCISVVGMIIPFGVGIAVSYALYKVIGNNDVPFFSFLLFLGVAMAITAFPVLARILTELKLLGTVVGATTISAAAIDDIVAWCLLALVISIVNSTQLINALFVFLSILAFTLFVFFAIRPLFMYFLRRTGSLENGPSQFVVFITLIMVLISGFITNALGVHAIFGGFIIGIMCPHESGFAVGIAEKIEDFIVILFLPIYFALSGLKTQIGLLNDAVMWGLLFLVIFVACFGKIIGCTLAAKANGINWRESLTIGFLMNCKGLVELIVLNLGMDAGVINEKIFVIMVVMALVTTFMTTPFVMWLYPPKYQKEAEELNYKKTDQEGLSIPRKDNRNILICLNKMKHIPAMMTLMKILQKSSKRTPSSLLKSFYIYALRLIEMGDRSSVIMKYNETEETLRQDPVMNMFRTFGQLNGMGVQSLLKVCKLEEFAREVTINVIEFNIDWVIIPWDGSGTISEDFSLSEIFNKGKGISYTSPEHVQFITDVFKLVPSTVAVFIDRGFGVSRESRNQNYFSSFQGEKPTILGDISDFPGTSSTTPSLPSSSPVLAEAIKTSSLILPGINQHILLLFFGGSNDCEALNFISSFANHPFIKIMVIHFKKSLISTCNDSFISFEKDETNNQQPTFKSTFQNDKQENEGNYNLNFEQFPTQNSIISETTTASVSDLEYEDEKALRDCRKFGIVMETIETATPFTTALSYAKKLGRKDLILVGRSDLNQDPEANEALLQLDNRVKSERKKALGLMAEGILALNCSASLLVIQGAKNY